MFLKIVLHVVVCIERRSCSLTVTVRKVLSNFSNIISLFIYRGLLYYDDMAAQWLAPSYHSKNILVEYSLNP